MQKSGLIVTSFGRQFVVECEGVNYQAVTKAKKTAYVVGDRVHVEIINAQQLQIVDLIPRINLVYRIDQMRSKIIASNVEQMLIVIAITPYFDADFLNSCLIFAESSHIKPIIIVNKIDLPQSINFSKKIYELYEKKLAYVVIKLSALDDCDELKELSLNKTSLLIGQSGVGKSTITNKIVPQANTRTGILGKQGLSGCHTTTNATLYHINSNSDLIDCPGLQAFGLYDIPLDGLVSFFPEFRAYLGKCKFSNCRHLNEPGCAIIRDKASFDHGRLSYLRRLTKNLLN